MSRFSRPFVRWAAVFLPVGVLFSGSSFCSAQELPAADSLTTPLQVDDAAPPPDAASAGDPASATGSSWANVPPPYSWPPLGWMFRRPTGPGYYSLCDQVTGNYRDKPPPFPWPPFGLDIVPMYDANFHYLDKPDNTEHDWIFDNTKRLHPGENWMFSIGGEERIRYENFPDYQLSGKDQSQTLERQRIYADLWYKDLIRVYVEYMDAQSFDASPGLPSPNDVRRNDLLNAFADVKIWEIDNTPLYFRIGRQELIYGSERLITSFDWSNVLRSFEGVKMWYNSAKLSVDAFYVQPTIPNADHGLSSIDDKQGFAGLWGTYRPDGTANQTLDLYVLNLDNANKATPTQLAEKGGRGGLNVTTLGVRSFGEKNGLLWDFENMYQCGQFTKEGISADSFSLGAGWHFANLPMNPSIWVYDEFASGTKHPGHGEDNTFNQLFPFSHYYFGWLDVVGRDNINDVNADLRFYPEGWITCLAQFHVFNLDSATDALYNARGVAIRLDPTGRSGTDVGDELDLCVSFHLGNHSDILLGYSKLYAGNYIKEAPAPGKTKPGSGGSPEFTYLQYSFRW